MQKVLLAGFGFMGRMHAPILSRLPGVSLCGVVDPRGEEIRGALNESGIGEVPVFTDLMEGLERSACSVVDICLPTDLHPVTASPAFDKGCHVFCEKPIALSMDAAQAMVSAATAAGKELMVGHCIRFWPAYQELEKCVKAGELGALVSLSMSRMTGRPAYAVDGWVNDPERCLGAALDLHIHDTDFLCHLLGEPRQVASRGIRDATGWSSISTLYDYDGLVVGAEGAWNLPSAWGFQMRFRAVFQQGVLDFDSRAPVQLMITRKNEAPVPVEPPGAQRTGYENELAYFFEQLERSEPIAISNGAQAARSLGVVLAEIESARTGLPVTIS